MAPSEYISDGWEPIAGSLRVGWRHANGPPFESAARNYAATPEQRKCASLFKPRCLLFTSFTYIQQPGYQILLKGCPIFLMFNLVLFMYDHQKLRGPTIKVKISQQKCAFPLRVHIGTDNSFEAKCLKTLRIINTDYNNLASIWFCYCTLFISTLWSLLAI